MNVIETITHSEDGEQFTAKTFLQYMRRSSPHWWNDSRPECSWSFRGHRNAAWELVPTAARPLDDLAHHQKSTMNFRKVIEQLDTTLSHQNGWLQMGEMRRAQILRYSGMYICLHSFMKLAVDLGFTINGYADFSAKLSEYLDQMFRNANDAVNNFGFSNFIVENPVIWETIALAQHHGVPTVFLDWTENPITACHFAAAGHMSDANIAVWGINTDLSGCNKCHIPYV